MEEGKTKGGKYTKADFIDSIYQSTGVNRKDVQEVIEHFLEGMKSALVSHGTVEFRGFGTFEVKFRRGRKVVRNPRTGETFAGHPHGIVFFRPGRELKKSVWILEEETVKPAGPEAAPVPRNEIQEDSGESP